MLKLVTFGPMFGLPDPSPFVMKAMALLKMSGLPHTFEPGDPRKGPKQKIPWLIDGDRVIADSTFIQRHLETVYGIDFYPGVDARQKAVGWAVEKMCEDHLYFLGVHERWAKDENFDKGPRQFFQIVPAILRPLVVAQVRRQVRNQLKAQGTGRHNEEEILYLAARDYAAIATLLGEKRYLFADRPTATDATVHAFLAAATAPFFDGPMRQAVLRHDNLAAYEARLSAEWYPSPA